MHTVKCKKKILFIMNNNEYNIKYNEENTEYNV